MSGRLEEALHGQERATWMLSLNVLLFVLAVFVLFFVIVIFETRSLVTQDGPEP